MEMLFFWIKKIVGRVFFPIPLFFELIAVGLILCIWKRTRRTGLWTASAGLFLLFILCLPFVGGWLVRSLENDYRTIDVEALGTSDAYVICVAGNCYTEEDGFNNDALIRLQEAGRIAAALERRHVEYKIVSSIYNPEARFEAKSLAAKRYYASFGIPESRVEIIDQCRNSQEEIAAFAKYKGHLIVVSNAYHMPRLMLLAGKARLDAMAAPAGWLASANKPITPLDFIPSAESLNQASIATYEYLGMLEVRLCDIKE